MAGLRGFHTVMSSELVGRIDSAAAAAGVSRGEFVRRAVEQALGSPGSPDAVAGVRGRVPAPVPAEQPVKDWDDDEAHEKASEEYFSRVRSSAAARPFRPAPKKGEK